MFDSFTQIPTDQRWRKQGNPVPIVVAIVHKLRQINGATEDTFLLIRRNQAPYFDSWALVGGKWEFGELLVDAIVREVLEETGLSTRFDSLQGIISERMYPAGDDGNGAAHFLILVCRLAVITGIAEERTEGIVGWFSGSEVEELKRSGKIIPSDYMMLKRCFKANPIPFYEVEMVGGKPDSSGSSLPVLHRFELTENNASTSG